MPLLWHTVYHGESNYCYYAPASRVQRVKSISLPHFLQVCGLSNSSEKISTSSEHSGHWHLKAFSDLCCSKPGQCCGVVVIFSSFYHGILLFYLTLAFFSFQQLIIQTNDYDPSSGMVKTLGGGKYITEMSDKEIWIKSKVAPKSANFPQSQHHGTVHGWDIYVEDGVIWRQKNF